jgi:hypothetical protein
MLAMTAALIFVVALIALADRRMPALRRVRVKRRRGR